MESAPFSFDVDGFNALFAELARFALPREYGDLKLTGREQIMLFLGPSGGLGRSALVLDPMRAVGFSPEAVAAVQEAGLDRLLSSYRLTADLVKRSDEMLVSSHAAAGITAEELRLFLMLRDGAELGRRLLGLGLKHHGRLTRGEVIGQFGMRSDAGRHLDAAPLLVGLGLSRGASAPSQRISTSGRDAL